MRKSRIRLAKRCRNVFDAGNGYVMFFGSSNVNVVPVGRNETIIFTDGLRVLNADRYLRSPVQVKYNV